MLVDNLYTTPNSLPDKLIRRALPDHQANPVDS